MEVADPSGTGQTTTSSNTPSSIKDGQSTENDNTVRETDASALSSTIPTGIVAQATSNDDTGIPIAAAPLTTHEQIKAATKEAMADFRREILAERQLHNEDTEAKMQLLREKMQEIEDASSKRMVLYLAFTSIVWLAVSSRDSRWV
ncbi:MAG: hypothetical protein Q9226_008257 [Calogaya cf. arnoldii]